MIDGDGNVRITDFGIATAVGDADAGAAGTPQYMAPEQLAGKPASIKTDIYALGLILFEIFTGRRAYDAKTLADLKQLHDTGTVTTPSSIVRDLDPAVERVILRCLERDPDAAAGVGARRSRQRCRAAIRWPRRSPPAKRRHPNCSRPPARPRRSPWRAVSALVAALLACIAVYATLSPRATMADLVPLDKPPAVLADRAQQILAEFGYAGARRPTRRSNFTIAAGLPRWLVETDQTPHRWNPARDRDGRRRCSSGTGRARAISSRTASRRRCRPPIRRLTVTGHDAGDPRYAGTARGIPCACRRSAIRPADAGAAAGWDALFRAAGLNESRVQARATPEWQPQGFRRHARGVGRAACPTRQISRVRDRSGGLSRQSRRRCTSSDRGRGRGRWCR